MHFIDISEVSVKVEEIIGNSKIKKEVRILEDENIGCCTSDNTDVNCQKKKSHKLRWGIVLIILFVAYMGLYMYQTADGDFSTTTKLRPLNYSGHITAFNYTAGDKVSLTYKIGDANYSTNYSDGAYAASGMMVMADEINDTSSNDTFNGDFVIDNSIVSVDGYVSTRYPGQFYYYEHSHSPGAKLGYKTVIWQENDTIYTSSRPSFLEYNISVAICLIIFVFIILLLAGAGC